MFLNTIIENEIKSLHLFITSVPLKRDDLNISY